MRVCYVWGYVMYEGMLVWGYVMYGGMLVCYV